jgi:hypothetical protein
VAALLGYDEVEGPPRMPAVDGPLVDMSDGEGSDETKFYGSDDEVSEYMALAEAQRLAAPGIFASGDDYTIEMITRYYPSDDTYECAWMPVVCEGPVTLPDTSSIVLTDASNMFLVKFNNSREPADVVPLHMRQEYARLHPRSTTPAAARYTCSRCTMPCRTADLLRQHYSATHNDTVATVLEQYVQPPFTYWTEHHPVHKWFRCEFKESVRRVIPVGAEPQIGNHADLKVIRDIALKNLLHPDDDNVEMTIDPVSGDITARWTDLKWLSVMLDDAFWFRKRNVKCFDGFEPTIGFVACGEETRRVPVVDPETQVKSYHLKPYNKYFTIVFRRRVIPGGYRDILDVDFVADRVGGGPTGMNISQVPVPPSSSSSSSSPPS